MSSSLTMFSGAVVLLLLVAVANVANPLLSRALTRQREMSVRAALGARSRAIRSPRVELVQRIVERGRLP